MKKIITNILFLLSLLLSISGLYYLVKSDNAQGFGVAIYHLTGVVYLLISAPILLITSIIIYNRF